MQLPVPLRRVVYRAGYNAMRVIWLVSRPTLDGVKCVITDGDSVLLVRHTYGPSRWDLPGGRIEGSEPPLDAAQREMTEELGLRIADWTSLGEMHVTNDHRRDTLYLFQVEVRAPALTIDRGELALACWFRRSGLPSDLAPHVIPILARTEPPPGD